MLGILVSCKLEEFDVTMEVGENIIGLSVSEAEFKIRNSGTTPSSVMFAWELQGKPKLENLRFAFKSLEIFPIASGCEVGYAQGSSIFFPWVMGGARVTKSHGSWAINTVQRCCTTHDPWVVQC